MKQKIEKLFILMILIFTIFAIPSFADNDELKLGSESAILIDNTTGKVLYSKNSEEKKYPASTTKILTAILAIENCSLDDIVTANYEAISMVPAGYSVAELQVGEQLTVEQLVEMLLINSADDAANVLAMHISGSIENFASLMNNKATDLGCTNTNFTNPSGKHDKEHYTTAHDLAKIMQYCMKNETFRKISGNKSCIIPSTNKYEERVYTNTNELLVVATRNDASNYYYQYAIAGKTGYTSQAKNCLVACSSKDNFELTSVVLGAGQDYRGLSYRFLDTKNLFEYGYNTYTIKKIRDAGAIAKQIEVPNATQNTKDLDLIIENDIIAVIKQSEMNDVILPDIKIIDNLSAPISENDFIGTITYSIDGVDYTSNLKASHLVKKFNPIFIIIQLILIAVLLFLIVKIFKSKRPKKLRSKYIY